MRLLLWLIQAIAWVVNYIIDAKNEERARQERRYDCIHAPETTDLSGSGRLTSFQVESMRMEIEEMKDRENERLRVQRDKYVFDGKDAKMDSIAVSGVIQPKEDTENNQMDSI